MEKMNGNSLFFSFNPEGVEQTVIMEQAEKTESKKSQTGRTGLILSLIGLIISLGLCALPLSFLPVAALPLILFLFLFASIFCLHGLLKTRNQKSAIAGMFVNICTLFALFFVFITFTPPGSVPPRLNRYKFKRACPNAAFWVSYDKYDIMQVKSQSTLILMNSGAISFFTKDQPYQPEQVIEYAGQNGWKYVCRFPLYLSDFVSFESLTHDYSTASEVVLSLIKQSPISVRKDCTVLVFDTGSMIGFPSYAFISKAFADNDEMIIFYQNPLLPDHHTDFFFESCLKLSKERAQ